jgi:hypothetical protein
MEFQRFGYFNAVYLTTLSISRLYSLDDRMNNECGAIGGMKIAGKTKVLGENPPQCHSVHHKSHIASDRTQAAMVRVGLLDYYFVALLVSGDEPSLNHAGKPST